ncbi:MAG: biosynthetic-type acetolactate synthase large subunit, partial [Actinobacteria bacterium]|nr:biosynthetic-type acetolactate synthase large subunit [Actinomycetota bacterium]
QGITKHNWLIKRAEDIPRVIREAFHVATTGRPGPVLVDLPKDISQAEMEWYWPSLEELDLPGYHPSFEADLDLIAAAADLLASAKRPVLYVGGGILKARGAEALKAFAEATGLPVVTTLMARGSLPDDHPLCLGMPGMHGNYSAITAMQQSDLLLSLGARFDDRVTGKLDGFAPEAKIIHIDIDPAELGKVRRPDVGIACDARRGAEALISAMATRSMSDISAWWQQIHDWQAKYPLTFDLATDGNPLKPQAIIEAIAASCSDDTIVVSGVGQHQMWAAQHWTYNEPYTWLNSGGAGTMGFAVPGAIGAKTGQPGRTVWAIDGDGCFQMTAQELVTARAERIPIKVAILNNAYLGMVRQWQEMFYEERYSEVYLSPDLPNYVGWAEAMGCVGIKVTKPEEVQTAIDQANAINDRPVVIDFRTDASEKVFPMVPAGASNDEVLVHPSQRGNS